LASVPVCSTAKELAAKPPSPTQKAEYVESTLPHVAAGCTHRPVTLANGLRCVMAYPAQFELVSFPFEEAGPIERSTPKTGCSRAAAEPVDSTAPNNTSASRLFTGAPSLRRLGPTFVRAS
jgi:hypothetical protein